MNNFRESKKNADSVNTTGGLGKNVVLCSVIRFQVFAKKILYSYSNWRDDGTGDICNLLYYKAAYMWPDLMHSWIKTRTDSSSLRQI